MTACEMFDHPPVVSASAPILHDTSGRPGRAGHTYFPVRLPTPRRRVVPGLRRLLITTTLLAASHARAAEDWDPFPIVPITNDFGGVGLIQTPTARFSPDGQLSFAGNRVAPYERYAVTFQAMPWLETTLRYSSIGNRLYSEVPEFSGNQSDKDRGLDFKLKLLAESAWRPAVVVGARDFLGTGLFQAEYVAASKQVGPFDLSFGIGWGLLGTRGHIANPLGLLSGSYRNRGGAVAGGGTLNNYYFKGDRVSLFGGVRYDTPIRGLTALVEYDPNDYQSEARGNRFAVSSPINVGLSYQMRSWLQLGASFERGNRVGLRFSMSTNVHNKPAIAKIDPPAPPMPRAGAPLATAATPVAAAEQGVPTVPTSTSALGVALEGAMANQGAVLVAAELRGADATLYVIQTRFIDMAQGLGRLSRAAFSVLPLSYASIDVVFVEGGIRTTSVKVYRHLLAEAVNPGAGSSEVLWVKTEFAPPPRLPDDNELSYRGSVLTTPPRLFWGINPGLRNTLGRPEQFILYQAFVRIAGSMEVKPGITVTGSVTVNLSDNFDQLRIRSDSQLQHVRSDIDQYLKQGRTAVASLQTDYMFNITPSLFGHVYGGLLEEMFGGVGGEVLWRPYDANWTLGADLSWVKQRSFKGRFGFQNYSTFTGFVTGSYRFSGPQITTTVRLGRYLAKDVGGTFEVSRRFRSGATVGAFATFTDVGAAEFGEGRFDKGLYITIPLDLLFNRHVRSGVGVAWHPLIRDGGQQLVIRQPLLAVTEATTYDSFRRDWPHIGN